MPANARVLQGGDKRLHCVGADIYQRLGGILAQLLVCEGRDHRRHLGADDRLLLRDAHLAERLGGGLALLPVHLGAGERLRLGDAGLAGRLGGRALLPV